MDVDDLELRLETEDRGVVVCERGDVDFGALCAAVEDERVDVDRGNSAFLAGTEALKGEVLDEEAPLGNAEFRNIVLKNESVLQV